MSNIITVLKFSPTFFSIIILAMSATSCSSFRDYMRPISRGIPKESDAVKSSFRTIHNDSIVPPFHFINEDQAENAINVLIDDKMIDATAVPLDEFVKLHKTLSFAIIRNDTVLYEYYASNVTNQTNVTSFSIAKSFVTMLIGIAIHEEKIKSVHQSIADFFPELSDKPDIRPITIQNLLQHTSGIKFSKEMFNPWSDNAEFYYTENLRKRSLNLNVKEPPGQHYDYQSENTMLLALILERTTEMSISQYLEQKIWTQIGTTAPATWNTDRNDTLAIEKAFCCLNARTMDFAKFGRLLLNKGNWNGKQVIPEEFIHEATTPSIKNGGKMTYGYNMGIGPVKYGSFFSVGLYGQFIYLYPARNVIIIRFGKSGYSYQPNYWKSIMLQIIDQL